MSSTTENSTIDRALRLLALTAVAVLFAALPWELYQRVPVGDTLVKIAGAVLIFVWIAASLIKRANPFTAQGFLIPIIIFGAMAALTLLWSEAPGASRFYLRVYATYALLFYAVAWATHAYASPRFTMALYVASAVAVGLLTVACYVDWLTPTAWMTAYWPRQPLIEEWRDGLPMRIVAAGNDFNQTSMFLVVAIAALVFLFFPRSERKMGWAMFLVALSALLFAVMLTMSRSAFLICAAIMLAMAFKRVQSMRGRATLFVMVAIGVVSIAIVQRDFFIVLWERAMGGIARDDGSVRNRMEVYQAGFGLAMKYFLTGAGIGASEAAMRIHYPEIAAIGQKVHSVPLLILIETGIVGLVAYALLWWQSFKAALRIEHRETRDAMLAVLGCIFVVLLVQPFQIQSAIPVLIGVAVGSARLRDIELPTIDMRMTSACAVGIVCVVVAFNAISYQRHFDDVVRYGDALAQGVEEHLSGHWEEAGVTYAEAAEIARSTNLANHPFWSTAERVYDLNRVTEALSLEIESAHPIAIAAWGSGQSALLTGNTNDAERLFRTAASADARFGGALYDLAEVERAKGNEEAAARYYAEVPPVEDLGGVFRERAEYIAAKESP